MARSGNRDRCIAGDEEMVRSAFDTARDMELSEGVAVVVKLWPTSQRGVWQVTIDAMGTRPDDLSTSVWSISGRFPNGVAGTLSAFLFGKMNSLSQMVSNARAEDKASIWGRDLKRR